MPIAQMHGLAARAAENFDYYAGVVTELHGRSFQVGDEFLNYTDPQAGRRGGADHALERAADALDVAHRAGAGGREHDRPQAGRVVAAVLDACSPSVLEEAGLPRGVFNVVHGFGETAGAPLTRPPGRRSDRFTGEAPTGKTVIAAGAQTLKRSSVELGGKSPVVVFADADRRAGRRRGAGADLHA